MVIQGFQKDETYGNATKITVSNEKNLKKGIKHGKKVTIKTKVTYSSKKHRTHREIKYESSNTKVATVSSKGVLKAKKKEPATLPFIHKMVFQRKSRYV